MTSGNRATKFENLYKSLKKHFKPVSDVAERTVLENLLYACCLQDARYEQADEAFAKLQQAYFDWNEVRVTTVIELAEALSSLPHSSQASARIKQCLQSLFESRYQYDIEDMKKANLGKAVEDLQSWKGMSPFVVSYVSQHALGGHSIPIGTATVEALVQCEIITPAEGEKGAVSGAERAIAKNKGTEFSSLLHQFAVEMQINHKHAGAQAVLKDMGVTYKPKPKPKPVEVKPAQTPKLATKKVTPAEPVAPAKPTKAGKPETKQEVKADAGKVVVKKEEPPKPIAGKPTKATPPAKLVTKPSPADSKKAEPTNIKKPIAKVKPEAKPSKTKEPIKPVSSPQKSSKKPVKNLKAPDKSKAKLTDKSKKPAKPVPKKVVPPPKTNPKSIASSITKKKPK